jgi:cytochrome P450
MPESSFSQERQSDQSVRSPSRLQSMRLPLPLSLVVTAPFYLTPRPAESDPATFSSDPTHLAAAQDDLALFQKGNFVRMDPPRHRKLAGLVSQAFTPRMVAGLEPRIAEVTTELLDATGSGERLDLIESLAYPLPVIVIGERPAGMVGSGTRC